MQKVLAAAGVGARRGLEQRIRAGEVQVNGHTAVIGDQVSVDDLIVLDGRRYRVEMAQAAQRTLAYHKPIGEVTSRTDPEGRATVFDRLPKLSGQRWIAIGRLDLNTSGLLLLTTDGELANQMMRPSSRIDREYLCRIHGAVDDEQLQRLLQGVELEDGPARFSDLVRGEVTSSHAWFTVTLMEGRNREVRRLWESVGCQVARLMRVRFGPVFLPERLRAGHYQELSPADHRTLRLDSGLPAQARQLIARPLDTETKTRPKKKRARRRR